MRINSFKLSMVAITCDKIEGTVRCQGLPVRAVTK